MIELQRLMMTKWALILPSMTPSPKRLVIACAAASVAAGSPAPAARPWAGKTRLKTPILRISSVPSPHPVLHETRIAGAYVALVPVRFDAERWRVEFLAQWPAGSAAWLSYFQRITAGPVFAPAQVLAAT